MRTVNIAGHEIVIHDDKKIGISLSGGADSAILLYILMANVKDHIHIYTMFSPERRSAMEPHVDMIVDVCSKLTNNKKYTLHKIPVIKQRPETLFTMLKTALDENEIDIAYTGLSKFPPKDVWINFPDQQPNWHNEARDSKIIKPLYGIKIPINKNTDTELIVVGHINPEVTELSIDERAYSPFVNLDKKQIAGIYKELNVEKELFPVTRSCETEKHPNKHCGKCWWCHERIWAFGYLE